MQVLLRAVQEAGGPGRVLFLPPGDVHQPRLQRHEEGPLRQQSQGLHQETPSG